MRYKSTANGIMGLGCFVIIAQIVVVGAIIVGSVLLVKKVNNEGLKNVIETVWEGNQE